MDPRAHRRFLDYLDAFLYFARPDRAKLERDAWVALDAEFTGLVVAQRDRPLSGEERARSRTLRALLLRD